MFMTGPLRPRSSPNIDYLAANCRLVCWSQGSSITVPNFLPSSAVGPVWVQDRGRDAHYWAPPAQIRTGPIRASGSYLDGVDAPS